MKLAPCLGVLVVICSVSQVTVGRPMDVEKDMKGSGNGASVYILGNLYNAAVSQDFSKSQAASDRNGSEWNSTEMQNSVHTDEYEGEFDRRGARILIYAGGDAANVAISYEASEAQAAENDKMSGYNNQNLGMNKSKEYEALAEDEDAEENRKRISDAK